MLNLANYAEYLSYCLTINYIYLVILENYTKIQIFAWRKIYFFLFLESTVVWHDVHSTSASEPDIELPFMTQQLNTGNAFGFCRTDDSSQTRRDVHRLPYSQRQEALECMDFNISAGTKKRVQIERWKMNAEAERMMGFRNTDRRDICKWNKWKRKWGNSRGRMWLRLHHVGVQLWTRQSCHINQWRPLKIAVHTYHHRHSTDEFCTTYNRLCTS